MKAILIDPSNKTITEVEHNGDYKDIQRQIGASLFDIVRLTERECLYVDDEGLLVEPPHPFGYFMIGNYRQILAGKGLILGSDGEGCSTDTTLTVEYLRGKVAFIDQPHPRAIEPKMEFITDPEVIAAHFGRDPNTDRGMN